MNILVIMHPAVGPLNSTFYLTKLLKQRGHDLLYLIPELEHDLRYLIMSQGFDTIITFDLKHDVNENFLKKIIQKHSLNAVIFDGDQLNFAILFYKYNVNKIFVNTCIQTDKEKFIPPFFSSLIPRHNLFSFIQIEMAWWKCFLSKKLNYWLDLIKGKNQDIYHIKLSKSVNFPLHKFASYNRAWSYRLNMYPEFFLYPIEFDFPRKKIPANQHMVGPLIDTDRKEVEFDWSKINSNPIVYCSLGTLAHIYYGEYEFFLKNVISVFENLPDINLLISVGFLVEGETVRSYAPNIHIYQNVPQLEVLKKTSLMITHGGLNSIKECIHFSVPMLVYPLGLYSDQFGNAARVSYHKIGKVGNIRDSKEKIKNDIKELFTSSVYKKSVLDMQSIFVEYKKNENLILDKIEYCLTSMN